MLLPPTALENLRYRTITETTKVDTIVLDEIAHLAQTRVEASPDADDQGLRIGDVIDLGVIGRENSRPLVGVAGVDHQMHGLGNPVRRTLGAEVIKHKKFGREDVGEDLRPRKAPDLRIAGLTQKLQERGRIVVKAAETLGQDGAEHGNRQVSLADARRADQQEPLVVDREGIREALSATEGVLQTLVLVEDKA